MHVPSAQDHNFYLQCVMELQRSIGKLESAIPALTSTAERQEEKVDLLNKEMNQAKGSLTALKWIAGVAVPVATILLQLLLKHLKLL